MTAIDFILADQNGPFLVAMIVVLVLGSLEMVSMMMGFGLSEMIDNLMPDLGPDVDLDVGVDVSIDADADLDVGVDGEIDTATDTVTMDGAQSNFFVQALGWLNVGRVPFMVLLASYLTLFAVIGWVGQSMLSVVLGLVPAAIAAPAAACAAVPPTRWISMMVGRLVPREETYAVSDANFVGQVARITLGPVDSGTPGKAKLTDAHGNAHFVRVRASRDGVRFETGAEVLLVQRSGRVFEAIAAPESLSASDQR